MATTEDCAIILLGEFFQRRQECRHHVGPVNIRFRAQDGLDRVDIDEAGAMPFQIRGEEGQVGESEGPWLVRLVGNVVDEGNPAEVGLTLLEPGDNDRT